MTTVTVGVDAAQAARAREQFDGLWERHHAVVYGYCHHFFLDEHRASDVTQRVFMDAWRALLDDRFDGKYEKAWLMRNAVRKCISEKRDGWGRFVRGSVDRLFGEYVTGWDNDAISMPGRAANASAVRAGQEALTDVRSDPATMVDDAVVVAQVQAVLSLLSPVDRVTLLAHEKDRQSCKEIADAFGTTPTAVKLRLFHGRERFRKAWIGRYGAYPQAVAA